MAQLNIQQARGCLCLVPYVFLVCVLAAGIGVFVTFMYVYITLNQEYRNNRGILAFLGALLHALSPCVNVGVLLDEDYTMHWKQEQ